MQCNTKKSNKQHTQLAFQASVSRQQYSGVRKFRYWQTCASRLMLNSVAAMRFFQKRRCLSCTTSPLYYLEPMFVIQGWRRAVFRLSRLSLRRWSITPPSMLLGSRFEVDTTMSRIYLKCCGSSLSSITSTLGANRSMLFITEVECPPLALMTLCRPNCGH